MAGRPPALTGRFVAYGLHLRVFVQGLLVLGRGRLEVWSRRPSPICVPLAHSVTVPPLPGLGWSVSNSHRHGHVPGRDLLGGGLLVGLHAEE